MPYFTDTILSLYLYLLPVIGFQHFIALWKAFNKSKQIAQFCKENFAPMPLKGICKFSVFVDNVNLGFETFENVFAYLNSLGQWLFTNVLFVAICNKFVCTFFAF